MDGHKSCSMPMMIHYDLVITVLVTLAGVRR